ncbi:MAG TPA: phosphoribosylanthranilate isomerase, partial [Methanotrichaceae archaeon]|nr:phosphoribosylanthranilate isomerase [Methanotrichaceae archaeon]
MTRVKICGIMDPSELAFAVESGADAVGFVVEVEGSRHRIGAGLARELIRQVPVFTRSVAVIAPRDVREAVDLADGTGADVLQVHGTLRPDDLLALKEKVSQKVVAAVPSGRMDLAFEFSRAADAVLLDTFKDGRLGGTGEVHDWSGSASIVKALSVPVILAGGLRPGNVGSAIRAVCPYAVDVSSG